MAFEFLLEQSVQYALISGIAIALFCSSVGLFLVLRKFALFGDALAHTAFGGVAFGLFIGVYVAINFSLYALQNNLFSLISIYPVLHNMMYCKYVTEKSNIL